MNTTNRTDTRTGIAYDELSQLAVSDTDEAWLARTRMVLQPIAAPSILGLFGFAMATMMVGAWQAGWYGSSTTPEILWPLTMLAGGLLQVIACAFCFRARDGIALAVHGVWGAFWLAWSTLILLVTLHVLPAVTWGTVNDGFGFWFIALALVTFSATLAATAQSVILTVTLGSLTAGSVLTAISLWAGNVGTARAGGWLFVISAAAAWVFGTAMMMEHSFGRTIIPLGKLTADANIPGRSPTRPIQRAAGMPGVRVGQ
ncbi:MAG: GPR1/FUN34/YaaH family transporter [Acidobacteriota bacterium]|nr:GPR1/FUN34/YaaH family transporter [Acidobacteriota bacterium]